MNTRNISSPQVLSYLALIAKLECWEREGIAWSGTLEVEVPQLPSQLGTKTLPSPGLRAVSLRSPGDSNQSPAPKVP